MDLDKLTSDIMSAEGFRSKPYRDTNGKLTIGYGRNLDDVGITNEEGRYLLSNNLSISAQQARGQWWWQYVCDNDARSRAMVELVFNMGIGGVSSFKRMLSAIQRLDWNGAQDELLDSGWAEQVGRTRSNRIASMLYSGHD